MAATLADIYNWFMTGKKPTEAQFRASWGSFWHKEEKIPQTAINNLENTLKAKAEKQQFDVHKTDEASHSALFSEKEDKAKKGAPGGYAPLNEFSLVASNYLDIVNNLLVGGATSIASAETVKTLKTQIDAINLLITSDDVNLDTVQKIVDAINNVQTALNTILVNDLTTGGTTKALTAEMGKLLQTTKVDKAVGERLISSPEIEKLSSLKNTTTTIKSITSTALATQNASGIVDYINNVEPALVVGNSELVKFHITDTGRIFELLLNGRSFGNGEPVITSDDVLEITGFLNKDLQLSNYANTRNDGGLPANKVLSTDSEGNVKLYSMPIMPAPYLEVVIPDSYLPSTTGNFILSGAFFTPEMCLPENLNNTNGILIQEQIINFATFISDNEIRCNVTTNEAEGSFDITLNNGLISVTPDVLLIVLGTVTKPTLNDWINTTGLIDLKEGNSAKVALKNTFGKSEINPNVIQTLGDGLGDYSIRFKFKGTPLNVYPIDKYNYYNRFLLTDLSDNVIYEFRSIVLNEFPGKMRIELYDHNAAQSTFAILVQDPIYSNAQRLSDFLLEIRRINSSVGLYVNNVLKKTLTTQYQFPLKIKTQVFNLDIIEIKKIEITKNN